MLRAPLRVALAVESLGTAGVGLWLLWVTTFVLPARDPAQIPMWRAVAVACLAFSALCGVSVASRAPVAMMRWMVLIASLVAVAFGVFGIVTMLRQSDAGGHFEGYILLMGVIFSGHGLTGIAYALLSGRGRDAAAGAGAGLAGQAS